MKVINEINQLDLITEKLTEAIFREHFPSKEKLAPIIRANIKAWLNVKDKPQKVLLREIKSPKMKQKMTAQHLWIQRYKIESAFWKYECKKLIGEDEMTKLFSVIDKDITTRGLKSAQIRKVIETMEAKNNFS